MFQPEQMLNACTVKLSSPSVYVVDSWFILCALIAQHHRCSLIQRPLIHEGPGETVNQLSTTHTHTLTPKPRCANEHKVTCDPKWPASHLSVVAVVFDVGADAMPAHPLLLGGPLGVEQGPHPQGVQAAALHQVHNGEAVGESGLHAPDPEVKPLGVLPGVHVRAQAELIIISTPGCVCVWGGGGERERERDSITLKISSIING